jgi:hypothetical protein
MRFHWIAALAATLLTCGLASAQPKDAGPTIEVRLRSVNDLVDKFEYLAGLAGKEDAVTQVKGLIKVLSAGGKGVEGIDPTKPIGAYATLTKEVQTSPFVVMIPIADEEQFLAMLKKRLNVTTERTDDGTFKAALPPGEIRPINEVYLRFTSGYVYAAPKAKDLDPKLLIKPEAYFAKDDGSAASLVVHIDRIPPDLKTFVLGQLELGVNEERKKNAGGETLAERRLKNFVFDTAVGGVKAVADDGKDFSVKLFAAPKTDDISAEVTLTARSGSPMAKNFASLGTRTSLPAGIVGSVANPAARAGVKVAVMDRLRKDYTDAIGDLLADVIKKASPEEEAIVKHFVEAFGPTLKAGELDAALALIGPDAKGRYQLIAAAGVTDGKKIEKFAKAVTAVAGGAVDFNFDIEKIGDFNLHRFDLKQTDEKFEKAFGTKSIWVAVSDNAIALTVEPDGKTLRAALKAKAVPAPVAFADVSAAKLLPVVQPDLKPDEVKALLKDAFGDGPIDGKDAVTLRVEAGNQLTLRLKVKGKVVRLGAGLDLLKGK